MTRSRVVGLLRIGVSLALLAFVASRLDPSAFTEVLTRAQPWWLLAAFLTVLIGIVLRAYRWCLLLRSIGARVPMRELIALYFVGFLFNNLLPGAIGGDAIRMLEVARHTRRGIDAVASVIVDRFLGLWALLTIGLAALLLGWRAVPPMVALATLTLVAGGAVAGFVMLEGRVYRALHRRVALFRRLTAIPKIGDIFATFHRFSPRTLVRPYAVSLLFNVTLVGVNACVGHAVGAQAQVVQYAVIVPIASVVTLLPVSLGGLGVREEAYRRLFGQVGMPAEIAVAIALLLYLFGDVGAGLIGGVIYMMRGVTGDRRRAGRSIVPDES